jgi:hypothetical protein
MSSKQVLVCDRCKTEGNWNTVSSRHYFIRCPGYNNGEFDLCPKCYRDLVRFIENPDIEIRRCKNAQESK